MILVICLLFATFTFAVTLLLGKFGKEWDLNPFLAFGSGGLLSLIFFDFLPHNFEEHSHWTGALIFLGIGIQGSFEIIFSKIKFSDKWLGQIDQKPCNHPHSHILSPAAMYSTISCLTLCSFFDGVRLYSALKLGVFAGATMSLGLFFHLLSESVILMTLLLNSSLKKRALFTLFMCLSGALILGSLATQVLSTYWNEHHILSVVTGILMYVCFIHLIPFCLKENKRFYFLTTGIMVFSSISFLHTLFFD